MIDYSWKATMGVTSVTEFHFFLPCSTSISSPVRGSYAPVPVLTGELGTKRFGYPVGLVPSRFGTQTVWYPVMTGYPVRLGIRLTHLSFVLIGPQGLLYGLLIGPQGLL